MNKVLWYKEGTPSEEDRKSLSSGDIYMPENYGILKKFRGTHPKVMQERVSKFPASPVRRSRWLNPDFYFYVLKHGFKG